MDMGSNLVATVATPTLDWETLSHCSLCDSEKIESLDLAYNLCRCQACGYVFDNPRPTLKSLVGFYSKPRQYDSWLAVEAPREQLWRRRLRKLLKHTGRGSLLDVGTGTGQFLNTAKLYFDNVTGTEVSQSGLRVAKEKYDLVVSHGELAECNLPRENFDTITLFHVLEHVPDPRNTLALCRELLRKDGILLVCVPNDVLAWTSKLKLIGKRLGLKPFEKFSPKLGVPLVFTSREIHLSHFTPTVLRRTLEQEGFDIVDESLDPYYSATGLRLLLHSAYYAFHRLLFAVLRVNRYGTIWVVAKKSSNQGNAVLR
jgi:SAM-dependent methyltransferase